MVYPSFHVVAGLAKAAGAALLGARSSRPDIVAALGFAVAGRLTLWLGNLTAAPVDIGLPSSASQGCRVSVIDEQSFEMIGSTPTGLDATARELKAASIRLSPYAVARVEV